MPSNFVNNFDPDRGDLIYGRDDDRAKYMGHPELTPRQQLAIKYYAFITIDRYNNLSFNSNQVNLGQQKVDEEVSNFRKHGLQEIFQALVKEFPRDEVCAYLNRLQRSANLHWKTLKSDKYSPERVKYESDEKLKREARHYLTGVIRSEVNFKSLAIRRACKFGIDFIMKHRPGAMIHFLLDSLDIRIVLNKETTKRPPTAQFQFQPPRIPVTTSELRHIFREWDDYRDRVFFYRDGALVPQPWYEAGTRTGFENDLVNGTISWKNYAQQRVRKYSEKISSLSNLSHEKQKLKNEQLIIAWRHYDQGTIDGVNRAANILRKALADLSPEPMEID